MSSTSFTFVDLFAGIGGFHAALGALGGECVYAVEKDPDAARVYQLNWGIPALGDITEDTGSVMKVPPHDVLAAGFPCQPFSKSGHQRGMDETRGTLFWNICRILEVRRPAVVLLENVRNLVGPRHRHEWDVIVRSLRQLGYEVSSEPIVYSPHLLPPERGGRPQVRERVFIMASYVGEGLSGRPVKPSVTRVPLSGWTPQGWSLEEHLPLQSEDEVPAAGGLEISPDEEVWIEAWDDFVQSLRSAGVSKLPGFPIWADAFEDLDSLVVDEGTPKWKEDFLRKNASFYTLHRPVIDAWLARWDGLTGFPASRRKFEWQAQDAESLAETVMHLRPSGLRAKRPTYVPALVAITQTSIVGNKRRRLSPREVARLQGLPEWFDFGGQPNAATYKQMGNGVNVGAAYHVFREHVRKTADVIGKVSPGIVRAVEESEDSPDPALDLLGQCDDPRIIRVRDGSYVSGEKLAAAV